MKKILFTLACMLSMSISAFGLANSAVLLQHGDQVTTYLADQLQDALDAAVDGDAIFLNKGTFSGFTITKQITLRGAGEETIIDGYVNIEIPDNPTLTRTLMESLKIQEYISIGRSIDEFKLAKVSFEKLTINPNVEVNNVLLDKCSVREFDLRQGYSIPNKLTVINSKVVRPQLSGWSCDLTFINCDIYNPWISQSVLFINSIINGGGILESSIFEYCLIGDSHNAQIYGSCNNCYYDDKTLLSELESIYTTEELIEKGYLGNDGTVVGIYGGTTPYVDGLTPIAPTVTGSLLKVDNENRKLNVKLTVSPK